MHAEYDEGDITGFCCFCNGLTTVTSEGDGVRITIDRIDSRRSEMLYAHVECLRSRLHSDFSPEDIGQPDSLPAEPLRGDWMSPFWAFRWVRGFLGYEDSSSDQFDMRVELSEPRKAELTPEQTRRLHNLQREKPDRETWTSEDLMRILNPDSPRLRGVDDHD